MKELKVGNMILVSVDNKTWKERELLTILPEDISARYTCRSGLLHTKTTNWEYAKPLQDKYVLEYDDDAYFIGSNNAFIEHKRSKNDIKKGRIRATEKQAKQALALQIRVMRLDALAKQLGGDYEWEENKDNFSLYRCNNRWFYKKETCYEPDRVYMSESTAIQVYELLNSGEFSLEVEQCVNLIE